MRSTVSAPEPNLQRDDSSRQIPIPPAPMIDSALVELLSVPEYVDILQALQHGAPAAQLVPKLKGIVDELKDRDEAGALRVAMLCANLAAIQVDPRIQATGAWALALARTVCEQHAQALPLYDQAIALFEAAGDPVEAALVRMRSIQSLTMLQQYDQAITVARTAQTILAQAGRELMAAELDENLGSIYFRLDQHRQALQHYDAARAVYVAQHEDLLLAGNEINRANALTNLDRFREAEESYQAARSVFAAHNQTLITAIVDGNLGYLYLRQGRYEQSLAAFSQARASFAALDLELDVLQCDLEVADVYLELNLLAEALEAYQRAAAGFAELGRLPEQARALAHTGVALARAGRVEAAAAPIDQALALYRAQGNTLWANIVTVYQASLLVQSGEPDRAFMAANQARRELNRQGARVRGAVAALVAAEAAHATGKDEVAERLFRSALKVARDADLPYLLFRAYHGLGGLRATAGANAQAYRYFRQAITALESQRALLPGGVIRSAFLEDKYHAYEDLVLLCLRLRDDGYIREALRTVERAKSRALVDQLMAAPSLRRTAADPRVHALEERLRALREELHWAESKASTSDSVASLATERRTALDFGPASGFPSGSEVRDLEHEMTQVLRQYQLLDAERASLAAVSVPPLSTIRQHLPAGTLLLEYFVARGRLLAFVVGPEGQATGADLGSLVPLQLHLAALRFQLGKFRYGPTYVERHWSLLRASIHEHLAALYDGLIAPLIPVLDQPRLVVVPHGLLHNIPFHALFQAGRYLLDTYELIYAPSASVLHFVASKRSRVEPPRADKSEPHIPDHDERPAPPKPVSNRRPAASLGPALILGVPDSHTPHIQAEVEAIRSVLPDANVLIGEQATRTALATYGQQARWIHLATHAVFRADQPLFSALRLGDGWLTVQDVYDLNLGCELVTLSGCETGLSSISAGDELIGLARGFFAAGTPSLVVSLWAVNDESTAFLMQHFYRNLLQLPHSPEMGADKSAALRAAQMATRERYDHPYYWGPFVLLGRR